MSLPVLSVVIPTHWGDRALLDRIIRKCLEQDIGSERIEVLLVFNAKEDPNLAYFRPRKLPAQIRTWVSDGPGVNRARNLGARSSRGRFIYFLDDDCEPIRPSLFQSAVDTLTCAPAEFVGIGGEYHDPESSSWAIRGFNLMTRLWIQQGLAPEIPLSLCPGTAYPALQLAGGNMAFRSEIFRQSEFWFDETLTAGGDETEFHRRLRNAGHSLLFSPGQDFAVIHHAASRTDSHRIPRLERATQHGRVSGEHPWLATGQISDSSVISRLYRGLRHERPWKDPAAFAYLGLHFPTMFATRHFYRRITS